MCTYDHSRRADHLIVGKTVCRRYYPSLVGNNSHDPSHDPTPAATTQQNMLITDKFPIEKWTTITITVDNNVTNVFIGTTLIKSIKIDNLSAPSSTSPIEFGNMPAHLANFSHSPSIIEPTPSYIQYITFHQ